MWMAYAEASESSSSEFADLSSAVISLQRKFERLAFDAEHEAIYGMNRFYSMAECGNIADNYLQAYNVCDKYLLSQLSIDELVRRLHQLDLTRFIFHLEDHLPTHLRNYLSELVNDNDDDNDGENQDEEKEENVDTDDSDGKSYDV